MSKKSKGAKKYFGVALDPDSGEVPTLVRSCIEYIDNHLFESGLFRIGGQVNTIADLRSQYDRGMEPNLAQQQIPHNVAGLLKLYLREMPQPLFTFKLYQNFLRTSKTTDKAQRLVEIKKLVGQLPATNYATSRAVVGLLHRVASCSSQNSMTPANLATVFATNILRPEVETIEYIVTDTLLVNSVFEFIIDNYPEIYDDRRSASVAGGQQPLLASPLPAGHQRTASGKPFTEVAQLRSSTSTRDLLEQSVRELAADDESVIVIEEDSGDEGVDPVAAAAAAAAGVSVSDVAFRDSAAAAAATIAQLAGDVAPPAEAEPEQQQPPPEALDPQLSPVWTFREQSYAVVADIYDRANRIANDLGTIRFRSDLVYVASLTKELFRAKTTPLADALADIKIQVPKRDAVPLQESQLQELIARLGKPVLSVLDEVAGFVENVAETMSVTEDFETLRPMDARFRWIQNVLTSAESVITASIEAADLFSQSSPPPQSALAAPDAVAAPASPIPPKPRSPAPEPARSPPPQQQLIGQRVKSPPPQAAALASAAAATIAAKQGKKFEEPAPAAAASLRKSEARVEQPRATYQPQEQPRATYQPQEQPRATYQPQEQPRATYQPPQKAEQPGAAPQPPRVTAKLMVSSVEMLIEIFTGWQEEAERFLQGSKAVPMLQVVRFVKGVLDHPDADSATLMLYQSQQPSAAPAMAADEATQAIVAIKLQLKDMEARLSNDMSQQEATETAELLRSITKAVLERDRAELQALS
eukprot:m51a1_g4781 hypothetical protein (758) ;mRNA; r:51215-54360